MTDAYFPHVDDDDLSWMYSDFDANDSDDDYVSPVPPTFDSKANLATDDYQF